MPIINAGYPRRDSRVIKAFRAMYENRCAICSWSDAPCDVHHILPLKDGGADAISNLVFLCPSCHRLAGNGTISPARLRHVRGNMVRRREAS